ncbi:MAG TPA: HAD-IA family hydrolase [Caulobacteraceae bacterium]|jgi:HAD superfamily hydrolase (TIGR01509 family)|nr:HAD-IA family hydrolase [Caulobacteraceae bacterium]
MDAFLALDLGGVVYRSWPDRALFERWALAFGLSADDLEARAFIGRHWGEAELGEITTDEAHARAAALLGVSREPVFSLVTDAFASRPDEDLARCVERLRRRGVRVGAFTNNSGREAELLARPELARLLDLAVSSADAGLTKPDPAFYRHAEGRFGVCGPDVVFLDDRPEHVETALCVGWRAFRFTTTAEALADLQGAFG